MRRVLDPTCTDIKKNKVYLLVPFEEASGYWLYMSRKNYNARFLLPVTEECFKSPHKYKGNMNKLKGWVHVWNTFQEYTEDMTNLVEMSWEVYEFRTRLEALHYYDIRKMARELLK